MNSPSSAVMTSITKPASALIPASFRTDRPEARITMESEIRQPQRGKQDGLRRLVVGLHVLELGDEFEQAGQREQHHEHERGARYNGAHHVLAEYAGHRNIRLWTWS